MWYCYRISCRALLVFSLTLICSVLILLTLKVSFETDPPSNFAVNPPSAYSIHFKQVFHHINNHHDYPLDLYVSFLDRSIALRIQSRTSLMLIMGWMLLICSRFSLLWILIFQMFWIIFLASSLRIFTSLLWPSTSNIRSPLPIFLIFFIFTPKTVHVYN